HVQIGAGSKPGVGHSRRRRHAFLVIEVNKIIGDVGQVSGGKIELRRLNLLAVCRLKGEVGVRGEGSPGVVTGELDAADTAEAIVEGREDDRSPELALVYQVLRGAKVAVDTERERVLQQLLLYTEVVVVGALGDRRVVQQDRSRGQRGGAGEFAQCRAADE